MKGRLKRIFGREVIEDAAVAQLEACLVENSIGVLSADAHKGYSMPVGGIIAYDGQISPSGVGYDIACGNKAVKTNLMYNDVRKDMKSIMDEVVKKIGFGVGRPNPKPIDHEVFDKIAHSDFEPQRALIDLATKQLGTVGSGNHFIDIFRDIDTDEVWIGNHFGSRGFGHKTASGFIALSQGLNFGDKHQEKAMDSEPILFDLSSQLGQDYMYAMEVAGAYAYAGRDIVVDMVLSILGGKSVFAVHNHHNFAWMETHFGKEYCVVRKGATPANPGQYGFIGSNMLDVSVIIQGVDSNDSKEGLYSTVHGAGRVLSRTQAAGKQKWLRDEKTGKKRPVRVSKGLVDFDKTLADMKHKNIELRGAGADEAPQCYKKLNEILEYHEGTIKVLHKLQPIGVAMAGNEVFDPYKD